MCPHSAPIAVTPIVNAIAPNGRQAAARQLDAELAVEAEVFPGDPARGPGPPPPPPFAGIRGEQTFLPFKKKRKAKWPWVVATAAIVVTLISGACFTIYSLGGFETPLSKILPAGDKSRDDNSQTDGSQLSQSAEIKPVELKASPDDPKLASNRTQVAGHNTDDVSKEPVRTVPDNESVNDERAHETEVSHETPRTTSPKAATTGSPGVQPLRSVEILRSGDGRVFKNKTEIGQISPDFQNLAFRIIHPTLRSDITYAVRTKQGLSANTWEVIVAGKVNPTGTVLGKLQLDSSLLTFHWSSESIVSQSNSAALRSCVLEVSEDIHGDINKFAVLLRETKALLPVRINDYHDRPITTRFDVDDLWAETPLRVVHLSCTPLSDVTITENSDVFEFAFRADGEKEGEVLCRLIFKNNTSSTSNFIRNCEVIFDCLGTRISSAPPSGWKLGMPANLELNTYKITEHRFNEWKTYVDSLKKIKQSEHDALSNKKQKSDEDVTKINDLDTYISLLDKELQLRDRIDKNVEAAKKVEINFDVAFDANGTKVIIASTKVKQQ